MTARQLFSTAATCALALSLFNCAQIGEAPVPGDDDENGDPNDNEEEIDPALCIGSGDSGETCEDTGDCNAPFVCLDGICVGPKNPDYVCDPIEGASCAGDDEVCVGGVCVINPGDCTTDDDCPLGYICDGSGECVPERDGEACEDTGPGPDLSGSWKFKSTLHLRDGLPGVVDGILDVAQIARDIIEGDLDLGLPGFVESLLGSAVASVIDNYVPAWAQNLVIGLGDVSDILDDMEVDSTVELSGQPCEGTYRGKETWDLIRFNFRGNDMIVTPDKLPGVDEIIPSEFAAWYSCGEVYFDRHTIKNSLSGLVRFLLDNITNATTGYPDVEAALSNMVDCYGFAVALDNYLYSICTSCPIITNLVDSACETAKNRGIDEVSEAIDNASVKMGLVKKKGIGTVDNASRIQNGRWYGSLVGGDFPGEFTATKN